MRSVGIVFPMAAIWALSCPLRAQTWTLLGTGDWFEPANWNSNTVPSGAGASINNGGTAVIAAPGAVAYDLRLGPGSLRIRNGGTLLSGYGYVDGDILVEDAGSSFQNSGSLMIGYGAAGSLTLRGGATVSSGMTYFRYTVDHPGTGLVAGDGSLWSFGSMIVAYGSQLTVRDGGKLSGTGAFRASGATITLSGTGARIDHGGEFAINGGTTTLFTVQGGGAMMSGGTATLDGSADAELLVTGEGSEWTSAGAFTLYRGRLALRDGGRVRNQSAVVERQNSDVGKVVAEGAGTTWSVPDGVSVKGEMTVAGGAVVESGAASLFDVPVVTVTGTGSKWTSAGVFEVQGALTVSDGGVVESALGTMSSHYAGSAMVTGAGSAWRNSGDLRIGCSSAGALQILDGAEVSDEDGYLGYYGGGTSTVLVSGAGSRWQNRGNLYVGYYSSSVPGVVTIAGGAHVEADGGAPGTAAGTVHLGYTGYAANTSGTLNIGSGGAAGTLSAGALVFGNANGRLVFNHTDAAHEFPAVISGPGGIVHQGTGKTLLGGGANFSGTTTVSSGALLVKGALGGATSPVSVARGATLGGSGKVGDITLSGGATLVSGDDGGDGSLNATSLTWSSGAMVQMDLGAPASSDKIILSGALTKQLTSGFGFKFKLGPDYAGPASYDIVTFGSTNFTAANFSTTGPVTGTFQIVNGNTLRFTTVASRPTITTAATATPVTAGATTTALSVLAADTAGESNLVYAWAASGPAAVGFTINQSNAAKSTTANFTKAGVYEIVVTASNAAGASATSVVTVVVGQRFVWWIAEQGLAGADASPLADPDGDGVANLLEYALEMHPGAADTDALPVVAVDGGKLAVAYARTRDDVVYQPEWSQDLVEWRTDGITTSRSGEVETAWVAWTGQTRRFLRLRVSAMP